MKSALKDFARGAISPAARTLASLGVTPNQITVAGLLFSILAGIILALGHFTTAGLVLLVGSLCDMLDGAVAREHGQVTRFGAFFDSTVDRLAEMAVFAGLVVYFHRVEGSDLYIVLALLAVCGSFIISYARARAEGLGLECSVGYMERPERLVLLIVAALIGPFAMKIALWILVPLVYVTTWQRVRHVLRETRGS